MTAQFCIGYVKKDISLSLPAVIRVSLLGERRSSEPRCYLLIDLPVARLYAESSCLQVKDDTNRSIYSLVQVHRSQYAIMEGLPT